MRVRHDNAGIALEATQRRPEPCVTVRTSILSSEGLESLYGVFKRILVYGGKSGILTCNEKCGEGEQ